MIQLKVQESKKIEDGVHTGIIKEIEQRNYGEFDYVDIKIGDIDGEASDFTLKYSAPANVTKNTKLGKLLETFGMVLEPNKTITVEEVIKIGMKVKFQTITEKSKKDPTQEFATIVSNSLKPVEEAAKAASTIPKKCSKCGTITNLLDVDGVCDFCKNADIKVERKSGPSSLHSNTDKEKLVEDAQAFLS